MVVEFQKMHNDLRSIKSEFAHDKIKSQQELVQLKDEAEETELSELFVKQSEEVQSILRNKQRNGLKHAVSKNLQRSFL